MVLSYNGSFTCYCGNTGVEDIEISQHRQLVDPGEQILPPGLEPTTF